MENEPEAGPVEPGDLFEGYQILKLLGQGGYASVYHARREFIDSDVAIKISNRAVTREVFRRFREEARLTKKLKHPNIVEVFDANVASSGHLYIVMELLLGQTFWDARKQYGKLTIPEALYLCAQAADGVEQAHRAGAIHRDLKPLNLFIVAKNCGKVLDFGIAKIADDGDRSSTQRNVVHGTLKYMSPEQLLAETLTLRSDIYALAVIFFELITGRHPHIAENARLTEAELGFAIVSRLPTSPTEIDPSIPSYIVEVIEKALSRDPAKRFTSMAEFAQALRECYERYVREFPQFAELRELWIPVPSASVVVRSAEPPSQEHIATAVVAVVPPQSLRPTVRVSTPPAQAEPQRPVVAKVPAVRIQIASTPAPVVGGVAVAPPPRANERVQAASPREFALRRIVSIGAAIGLVSGMGLTVARLRTASGPRTPPSVEPAVSAPITSNTVATVPSVPRPNLPPTTQEVADTHPTSVAAAAPKPASNHGPATSTQAKPRPAAQTDKNIADRVNWYHDEPRPSKPSGPKSRL